MFVDYDKAGNRQVLKESNHIKIMCWCYGYNEISKEFMYKVEARGAYRSRQDLQKAKDFIFSIAKIAGDKIYSLNDTEINIKLSLRFDFERKEKLEVLEQIQDLARNYQ